MYVIDPAYIFSLHFHQLSHRALVHTFPTGVLHIAHRHTTYTSPTSHHPAPPALDPAHRTHPALEPSPAPYPRPTRLSSLLGYIHLVNTVRCFIDITTYETAPCFAETLCARQPAVRSDAYGDTLSGRPACGIWRQTKTKQNKTQNTQRLDERCVGGRGCFYTASSQSGTGPRESVSYRVSFKPL